MSGDDLPKDDAAITHTISSAYQTILHKLKTGGKFLDIGCMFAQDTRKLVYDGVPAANVYGSDLHNEYFDFGYKLFRDEAIIPRDHFIAADILDSNSESLAQFEGKLDVINNTHLMHVFSIEDQALLLKRFIGLLRPEPGVMITGRVTGNLEGGYHELSNAKATVKGGKGQIWEHNVDTLRKLWREVGEETGTKWDVKAWFWRFGNHTGGEDKPANWHRKPEHGIVTFIVTRL
jgi:SAM-dependent methyltransferase